MAVVGWGVVLLGDMFSKLDPGPAVVGDGVEEGGLAEAFAILIDDGREADALAPVADGDGGVAQVAGAS
jgi:hypothetical protein